MVAIVWKMIALYGVLRFGWTAASWWMKSLSSARLMTSRDAPTIHVAIAPTLQRKMTKATTVTYLLVKNASARSRNGSYASPKEAAPTLPIATTVNASTRTETMIVESHMTRGIVFSGSFASPARNVAFSQPKNISAM